MRKWQIKTDDPGSYILAADARWGGTDYTNDHIWELKLKGGEPPALSIQTTFGLRARNYRIFPRFIEGDSAITDPELFSTPLTINRFDPNYLVVSFSPFAGIDVTIEYWVVASQVLAGRLKVANSRLAERLIRTEISAILTPTNDGERMAAKVLESVAILCGKTDALYPVIYMTGGPEISAGPFPALSVEMSLTSGATRQITWVQTAGHSVDESYALARKTATKKWDSEIAKITVGAQRLIDIQTGDPDWDMAFALAQKSAFNLLVGPTESLPNLSFVQSRQPDQGYSVRGDGSDYGHLWAGQTPLETYYLCTFLLPNAPDIAQGLLENFLEIQSHQGFIDWKPGLAGQRGRLMATPILTKLAWEIYEITEDKSFLEAVFPKLLIFVRSWFSAGQDRDGDGLPEWSRASHSGFEDHPIFSQWQSWAQGADISKTESPSLCAFLYQEIKALCKIAKCIEATNPQPALEALAENIKSAINTSWDANDAIYRNWDRETHFSPNGEFLGQQLGSGNFQIQQKFSQPVRILVQIETQNDPTRDTSIFIHGIGPSGTHRIERIESEQFQWFLQRGNATSERVFYELEFVEISGLQNDDLISFQVLDLSNQDHTLLLPLWAGLPDDDRAFEMVKQTITNPSRFWKPFGISACSQEPVQDEHPCHRIDIIWNHLIGEGMLSYGYRGEAASLVTNLMAAIVKNLKKENAFFNHYNASTGRGIGERNALGGLAPIRLFLETLGVRILSSKKIFICGENPFPWDVTIHYRGMKIVRGTQKTSITFAGGQTALINNPEPRIITLEEIKP